MRVAVIIPALNEEQGITRVISSVPLPPACITVADNGSTDRTAERALAAGARVVFEPRRGYGRACQAGLRANAGADVIVFLDADFSDYPEDLRDLVGPILGDDADFVLGARGGRARPWHARLGTSACVALINRGWGTQYADLGPFRAISRRALDRLALNDQTWGWTIEMQIKAAEAGLRIREVPVRYRERIGQSKISGSLAGTLRAGGRMLGTIGALWFTRGRRRYPVYRSLSKSFSDQS